MPAVVIKFCVSVLAILCAKMVDAETIAAYTDHEPPLNFTVASNKNYATGDDIQGFSADVVREIMARTSTRGLISIIPWSRSYRLLQTKPNVMLFSMARTPLREHQFQWVGPLAYSKSFLYVKRGSGIAIQSLDDAHKLKNIGVIEDDSKEQFLKSKGFTNLDHSQNWAHVFHKLHQERIAALTMTDLDLPIVAQEQKLDPAEFEPVYELFVTRLYIGFSKSTSPELVQSWQAALDGMKQDGTFRKLAEQWSAYWKMPWVVRDGAVQAP